MNNMGGLVGLWQIDANDFVSLEEGENSIYDLTLDNGATPEKIDFTHDTGKISETEEDTDNGTVYNFETTCSIPKCGPDNAGLAEELRNKRILILGEDQNGNFWLAGSPGSYFKVTTNSNTGESTQDKNSRQLKISSALPTPCVFITSPFQPSV